MPSYAEEVLADAPYRLWRMGDAASPLAEESGSTGITITGATLGVAGAFPALGNAVSFNGTTNYGRVASGVDLSAVAIITVEFWLFWDVQGTGDDLAGEFGDANAAGGWAVDPDDSSGATHFGGLMSDGAGGFCNMWAPDPTTAAWHHHAIIFSRAASGTAKITFYMDGVVQTTTQTSDITTAGNFGNLPLTVMARTTTGVQSLFGAGDMQWLAIYKSALSAGRISAHYAARANASSSGGPGPLRRFPLGV